MSVNIPTNKTKEEVINYLNVYPEHEDYIVSHLNEEGFSSEWLRNELPLNFSKEYGHLKRSIAEGFRLNLGRGDDVNPVGVYETPEVDLRGLGIESSIPSFSPSGVAGNIIGGAVPTVLASKLGAAALGASVPAIKMYPTLQRYLGTAVGEGTLGGTFGYIDSDGEWDNALKHAAIWSTLGLIAEPVFDGLKVVWRKIKKNDPLTEKDIKLLNDFQNETKALTKVDNEVSVLNRIDPNFDIENQELIVPPSIIQSIEESFSEIANKVAENPDLKTINSQSIGWDIWDKISGAFSSTSSWFKELDPMKKGDIIFRLKPLMQDYVQMIAEGKMSPEQAIRLIRMHLLKKDVGYEDQGAARRAAEAMDGDAVEETNLEMSKGERQLDPSNSAEQKIKEDTRPVVSQELPDEEIDELFGGNIPRGAGAEVLTTEQTTKISHLQYDAIVELERKVSNLGGEVATGRKTKKLEVVDVSNLSMEGARKYIRNLQGQLSRLRQQNSDEGMDFLSEDVILENPELDQILRVLDDPNIDWEWDIVEGKVKDKYGFELNVYEIFPWLNKKAAEKDPLSHTGATTKQKFTEEAVKTNNGDTPSDRSFIARFKATAREALRRLAPEKFDDGREIYNQVGLMHYFKMAPPKWRRGLSQNPLARIRVNDTMTTLENVGRDMYIYLGRVKNVISELEGPQGSNLNPILSTAGTPRQKGKAQSNLGHIRTLKLRLIEALDAKNAETRDQILSADETGRLIPAYSAIRGILDELADLIGLPKNERISHYFPHIYDSTIGSFRARRVQNELNVHNTFRENQKSRFRKDTDFDKSFSAERERLKAKGETEPDFNLDFDEVVYAYIRGAVEKSYMTALNRRMKNTILALKEGGGKKLNERREIAKQLSDWYKYIVGHPSDWKMRQATWWRENETFNKWMDNLVGFLGGAENKWLISRARHRKHPEDPKVEVVTVNPDQTFNVRKVPLSSVKDPMDLSPDSYRIVFGEERFARPELQARFPSGSTWNSNDMSPNSNQYKMGDWVENNAKLNDLPEGKRPIDLYKNRISKILKEEEGMLTAYFNKLIQDADKFENFYNKDTGTKDIKFKTNANEMKRYRAELALMIDDLRAGLQDPASKPIILEKLYGVMVLNKLGFSVSHGLMNLGQFIQTSMPKMGVKWVAKGISHYSQQGNRSNKARINGMVIDDIVEESGVKAAFYESTQFTNKQTPISGLWGILDEWGMKPATISEDFLRVSTLLGAYEKGFVELGLNHGRALAYAKEMVRDTQFVYDRSGIPTAFQKPFARFLLMFKTYPIHMTTFSADLLEDAIKKGDWEPLFKHVLAYLAMAGAGATFLGGTRVAELQKHPAQGFIEDIDRRGLVEALAGPPSSSLLEILHGQYQSGLSDWTDSVIEKRIERAIDRNDASQLTGLTY